MTGITGASHADMCKLLILVLRMRNVPYKSSIENQNTYFMFSYIFPENRAAYAIMWKIWYRRTGHR